MKTTDFKLTVTFITPVLGSQSTKEVATEFIAARSGITIPDDEERTLPDELERGTTVFHRNPAGEPLLFDFQIKGFLKNAGKVLNGKAYDEGKNLPKNLRSKVSDYLFVQPRTILLRPPNAINGQGCAHLVDFYERPLRAETARGPRVALARSEMLPEGVNFACQFSVFPSELDETVLRELLDYGYWNGLLQFRSGGYGRFRYELSRE